MKIAEFRTHKSLKIILTVLALSYLPITIADNTVASASWASFYVTNSQGKTWAWGGDVIGSDRITATPLVALNTFHIVKISTVLNTGAALTNNGKVFVWGHGGLGDGDRYSSTQQSPLLTPFSEIVDVVATRDFKLVVKENGEVWGWGSSSHGVLGESHDTLDKATYTPVQIKGLPNIIKIASQGNHILAIDSHGDVWSWGDNGYGVLGQGTSGRMHYSPAKIQGLSNIIAIETGQGFSMALSANGDVFSWGNSANGQLGQGKLTATRVNAPVQIGLLKNIKTISAGYRHALAISHDGEVWVWGANYKGQVGDGTEVAENGENGRKYTPIKLAISGIVAGAASDDATVVIKADGSVWTWGGNYKGQIGINISSSAADTYLEPQQVMDSSLEFLNLGESTLSNKVIVDSNLNIQIPSASYQSSDSETNIWVNLEFKGVDSDGDYIWKLKDYGNN